jgi:hypothetical protein
MTHFWLRNVQQGDKQAYCVCLTRKYPEIVLHLGPFCTQAKQDEKNNERNLRFTWGELSLKNSHQMAEARWPCPQNFTCLACFTTEQKGKLIGSICWLPRCEDSFEWKSTRHSQGAAKPWCSALLYNYTYPPSDEPLIGSWKFRNKNAN